MSIQTALQFMQRSREDESLQHRLQSLGRAADLPKIVRLGAEFGLVFTEADLRAAFKHDWAMRWFQQQRRGAE